MFKTGIVLGLLLIAIAILVFGARRLVAWSKARAAAMQAVHRKTAERYGLDNRSPEGVKPDLHGHVDGLAVAVDVYHQSYSRGGESAGGQRPWTRVRVQLESDLGVTVRRRHRRYDAKPGERQVATGDPQFDAHFVVHAADGARVGTVLSEEVRAAFLGAPAPVDLDGRVVLWLHKGHVQEPQVLLDAVEACLQVGRMLHAGRILHAGRMPHAGTLRSENAAQLEPRRSVADAVKRDED
ncbi:MAG: hypothetical protein AAFY88_29325 [Acidobacteriota bacterium]